MRGEITRSMPTYIPITNLCMKFETCETAKPNTTAESEETVK